MSYNNRVKLATICILFVTLAFSIGTARAYPVGGTSTVSAAAAPGIDLDLNGIFRGISQYLNVPPIGFGPAGLPVIQVPGASTEVSNWLSGQGSAFLNIFSWLIVVARDELNWLLETIHRN